jgi:hypothetical protein
MEKRKPWVPKRKQLSQLRGVRVQHTPPATRREYLRMVRGRAMLNKAFQYLAGHDELFSKNLPVAEHSKAYCLRKTASDFGVTPQNPGESQISFEQSAKLIVKGLHLYSFKRWREPFSHLLVARFVNLKPNEFGRLLGKKAGLFARDMGRGIGGFLSALGPNTEPFLAGLGPNVKEFAEGMRDYIGPFTVWLGGFKENFGRGLGKNAGFFSAGLGKKAEHFAILMAYEPILLHEPLSKKKIVPDFLRGLGPNCKLFARGLGKHADLVADAMKASRIDSNSIRLLTGKIR